MGIDIVAMTNFDHITTILHRSFHNNPATRQPGIKHTGMRTCPSAPSTLFFPPVPLPPEGITGSLAGAHTKKSEARLIPETGLTL